MGAIGVHAPEECVRVPEDVVGEPDSISATDASPVMRAYACAKSAQPTGSDAVPLTVPSGAPTQHQ